jgi:uncharacterized protein (TIGR03067 family)
MKTCVLFVAIGLSLSFSKTGWSDDEKEAAVKKYVESLQGEWQMISRVDDGEESPKDLVNSRTTTFKSNKYVVKNGEEVFVEVTYKVDPGKDPVWIDITYEDGDVHKGLIQLKGDTLTFILSRGGERPKEFKSKAGSNYILAVYKKKKQ